jgi:hypothetical protein
MKKKKKKKTILYAYKQREGKIALTHFNRGEEVNLSQTFKQINIFLIIFPKRELFRHRQKNIIVHLVESKHSKS